MASLPLLLLDLLLDDEDFAELLEDLALLELDFTELLDLALLELDFTLLETGFAELLEETLELDASELLEDTELLLSLSNDAVNAMSSVTVNVQVAFLPQISLFHSTKT